MAADPFRVLVTVGWENSWPCGCLVLEGLRLDRGEAVVGCWPCGPGHKAVLDGVPAMLRRDPDPRPLHEAVVERLAGVNLPAHAA